MRPLCVRWCDQSSARSALVTLDNSLIKRTGFRAWRRVSLGPALSTLDGHWRPWLLRVTGENDDAGLCRGSVIGISTLQIRYRGPIL